MVTGNGNSDAIPADFTGRVLWASKHFGVITVFSAILLYQGSQFIETQRAERKEQGTFLREALTAVNTRSVEAITKATMAVEAQTRESEQVRSALDRNASALESFTRHLDK